MKVCLGLAFFPGMFLLAVGLGTDESARRARFLWAGGGAVGVAALGRLLLNALEERARRRSREAPDRTAEAEPEEGRGCRTGLEHPERKHTEPVEHGTLPWGMYFGPVGSEAASQVGRQGGQVVELHEDGLLIRFEVEGPDRDIESFLAPDQPVSIVVFPPSPPAGEFCTARAVIVGASMTPGRDANCWTVRLRYTKISPEDRDDLRPGRE